MGTPERELAGGRQKADPRESLRKRRILKLALTAHKVLLANSAIGFLAVYWL